MKSAIAVICVLLSIGIFRVVVDAQNPNTPLAQNALGTRAYYLNSSSTGTALNTLTKLTGAPSKAVIVSAAATSGVIGIAVGGAGTTGTVTVQTSGNPSCVFDGATTAGHYVQISASVAGNCTDSGASYPTSGQVIGRVTSTNAAGGTFVLDLFPSEIQVAVGASGATGATGATGSNGAAVGVCDTYTVNNNGANWTVAKNGGTAAVGAAIAAAVSQSITLFALSGTTRVLGVEVHGTTGWSGTGFTGFSATVGDSVGGALFYEPTAFDLTTSGNTAFIDAVGFSHSTFAGSNIQLVVTANQALNAHTITGVTDVGVCSAAW